FFCLNSGNQTVRSDIEIETSKLGVIGNVFNWGSAYGIKISFREAVFSQMIDFPRKKNSFHLTYCRGLLGDTV
ncbi:MAG: hypothetical protein UX41_C0047G0007, partial [Candidatus Collierbacteria bacterium GW2011_GWE1_46_18]